jgi:hypothetical protein
MKSDQYALKALVLGLAIIGFVTGCESEGGGGSVSGGVYYGTTFYDPWYYGHYHGDMDIIVTPPPGGGIDSPSRPSHPIATPPSSSVRPTPMPSIPSMPRVSARR